MTDSDIPQLVAHRGFMQHYPENSWRALEAALQAGACWLEFDVQMCADGRFILLHDADFMRTAGNPQSVFDAGLTTLQNISIHEPERLGEHFAPLPAPGLDTVLQQLARYPEARAMVEIKDESLAQWELASVMEALLKTLAPFRDQCVLIAYSDAAIAYTHQHSDMDTGWVLRSYDQSHHMRATALAPQFLICNERKIPDGEQPWSGDWQWMLYDIHDPQRALHWAQHGVALIETGDIGAMLQHPQLATRACQHDL